MKLIKLTILTLGLIYNFSAIANSSQKLEKKPQNDIYKIEIIVFTNNVKPENLYSSFDKLTKPKKINTLKDYIPEPEPEVITELETTEVLELSPENQQDNLNNSSDLETTSKAPESEDLEQKLPLFSKLDSNEFFFQSIDKKLNSSTNYKIISHYAWYQDLAKKSSIYLNGGENYYTSDKNNAATDILVSSNNPFDDSNKLGIEKLKTIDSNAFKYLNPEWELEGVLSFQKFTRSKIHADINLLINTPVMLTNYLHYKTFAINQNRNIVLNEINYFDNPYFGALVYITKA